uniref:Uncharacterized protein n=1 Tax=Rhizophora mucronata TaxID=61149 RepID=A0A2P2KRS7_RHIMU
MLVNLHLSLLCV